MLLSGVYF